MMQVAGANAPRRNRDARELSYIHACSNMINVQILTNVKASSSDPQGFFID